MSFDEVAFVLKRQEEDVRIFLEDMARIDEEEGEKLKCRGWKYRETAVRTVMFTFGDAIINRRCYEKDGVRRYPVDEHLGLLPNARYSVHLLFKLALESVDLSFRKAARHFSDLLNLNITKDAVLKARKMATQLYKERDEYRFFEDDEFLENARRQVDVLYIEGDGLIVSTPDKENAVKKTDFSHFIVHEGVEIEYGGRYKTKNRKEFWSYSNKTAREQLLDYLHNTYEIRKGGVLITNSDMGHGYTPYVFQEIAKSYPGAKHEHFWDRYHLNLKISDKMKKFPLELEEKLFEAVNQHNKKLAHIVFDIAEDLIPTEDTEWRESFEKFRRKFLRYFPYTQKPEKRGFSGAGIGVLEGNHTKLSYRLKHQGRYWSKEGAQTMGRMIIDKVEGRLEELWFGDWREQYAKFKSLDSMKMREFKKRFKNQQGGVVYIKRQSSGRGSLKNDY